MVRPLGLSSVDITNLVKELQPLVGGHLNKFYQLKNRFTLKIHTKQGNMNLNIVLPGLMFCSETVKYASPSATPFAMGVRKRLLNRAITGIKQEGTERIVRIDFIGYSLIVELFSRGNLVLIDTAKKILALYSTQKWSIRTIKIGKEYQLPPRLGSYQASVSDIAEGLSIEKNPIKLIATQLGLGGVYAEEIRGGFSQPIEKLAPKEIHAAVQAFIRQPLRPLIYYKEGMPIALSSYKLKSLTEGKPFNTISDMVAAYMEWFDSQAPSQDRFTKLKAVIAQQQQAIVTLEKKVKENMRKGELIYENYTAINSLISKALGLKQKQGWSAALEFLRKHPRVVSVNQKELSFTYRA